MRMRIVLLVLAVSILPTISVSAADGRAQLVEAICSLPEFGPRPACECAVLSLIDTMGETEFRAGILGELPAGMDRDRERELALGAPPLIAAANAQCGARLPAE